MISAFWIIPSIVFGVVLGIAIYSICLAARGD